MTEEIINPIICAHCLQVIDSHNPIERLGQLEDIYYICPIGLKLKGVKRADKVKFMPITSISGPMISNPNTGLPLAMISLEPAAIYLLTTWTPIEKEKEEKEKSKIFTPKLIKL